MTHGVFTLLYNDDYLAGALVLAINLRRILERRPENDVSLGVMIDKLRLNEYQVSLLQNLYDDIVEVDQLESQMDDRLAHELGRPELKQTFTKIQLWSLTKYDKILYLDADTLPNIPKDKSQGSIFDLLKVEFAESKILAAPDSGFPDIFNSGVMLLKPNDTDYTNLFRLIQDSGIDKSISFDGADQGLLNQYFNRQPDWVQDLILADKTDIAAIHDVKSSNWIHLPFLYNVTPSEEYEYLPAYKHFANTGGFSASYGSLTRGYLNLLPHFDSQNSKIKLFHFIGPLKPWNAQISTGIYGQWWDTWYGYFGNVTIAEVLYHGANNSSPKLESIKEPEENKEETQENLRTEILEDTEKVKKFDPSYLCDPANYQHIPTNIAPSIDASWDPAKEPPPKSVPLKNEPAEFEQGMRSFANVWDSKNQMSVETPAEEPPAILAPQKDEEQTPAEEIVSSFGYHASQKSERVFNDNDVALAHPYMPTDEKPELTETRATPTVTQLPYNALRPEQVNDKLDKLTLGPDSHAIDEDSDFGDSHDVQNKNVDKSLQKKLFPWEFRESKYAPERTFD